MRSKPWMIRTLMGLIAAVLVAAAVIPQMLPGIMEPWVLKRVSEATGLKNPRLDLRNIGIFGADAGDISTGTSVSVDSIHLEYTPVSLMNMQLEGISLAGLVIRAGIDESGVSIADFPLQPSGKAKKEEGIESVLAFIPLLPQYMAIRHSMVVLESGDLRIPVPFDLVVLVRASEHQWQIQAAGTVFDNPLEARLVIGPDFRVKNVIVKAPEFMIGTLEPLIDRLLPGISLGGKADFHLESTGDNRWNVSVSGVDVLTPVNVRLQEAVVSFTLGKGGITGAGTASLKVLDFPDIRLASDFGVASTGDWNASLKVQENSLSHLFVTIDETTLDIRSPEGVLTAEGKGSQGRFRLQGKAGPLFARSDTLEIDAAQGQLESDGRFGFGINGPEVQFHFECSMRSPSARISGVDGKADTIHIEGKADIASGNAADVRLVAGLVNGRGSLDSQGIALTGIEAEIPLCYPFEKTRVRKGRFHVDAIRREGIELASASGDMEQTATGFSTSSRITVNRGIVSTEDAVTLTLNAGAAIGLDHGLTAVADVSSLPFSVSLTAPYLKEHAGLKSGISGRFPVQVRGAATWKNARLDSSLKVMVEKGQLSIDDPGIVVDGIATTLVIEDLVAGRSLPGQVLTIDGLTMNTLKVTDIRVRYTLESPTSVLLEKSGFNWCGGRVSAESMRLSSGKKDLDIILYCDRLHLAELLRQIGSFKAEGDGSLNGRLPVNVSNGEITFENGFLFSTPGVGGIITITGADLLTAGIPENTVQFAQVDLAREALKYYHYDWARLYVNSTGDTLNVNMKFDGRPERLLPFVYRKEMGGFVRVDASSPGSRFQGIKIDVNLSLPFARMMKFGRDMDQILKTR